MSTTPPPALKKSSTPLLYALGLLILVVLAAGSVYEWHSRHKSSPSSAASDFSEYKATKYGFKFNYPQKWGTPTVTASTGTTGKTYTIHIQQAVAQNSAIISASFDSKDLLIKDCDAQNNALCSDIKAFTSDDVTKAISSNKNVYTVYSNDSTGIVSSGPAPNAQSLSVQEIISVPSLNATAARGLYTINNASKACAANKFSSEGTQGCITKSVYNNMTEFLSSLHSL